MSAKITPTTKKMGSTVFGVRIGCHAFKRCWRNAVSWSCQQAAAQGGNERSFGKGNHTCRSPGLLFLL